MPVFECRWGPIHAEVRGSLGVARPIALLLHGGHGSWRHWMANLDHLSRRFDLVVPDLPGFGASCEVPPETGLELYCEAFREALAPLPVPALVLGFSFGTLVGTASALQWQQAGTPPGRLMLINPPLGADVSPEVLAILGRAADAARAGGLDAGVAVTQRELMLSDPARLTPELISMAAAQVRSTRFLSRPISRRADIRQMIKGLASPCDIVLGDLDPHQRAALGVRVPEYRGLVGETRVHVLPGAAHWLQYDQAEAFARLVERVCE